MEPLYKRVLIKLSGEVLGGAKGSGFDFKVISSVVAHITAVYRLGVEVGIVVGGGNIFRGAKATSGNIGRVAGDHMGMLATVINSICLQEMLEQQGMKTRVLSAIEMHAIAEPYIKRRADRHLEKRRVVIFAAGTGNPYFTTDTASVLRASEIGAEIVIKATKIDGVYDKDPKIHSDAILFNRLTYSQVLEKDLAVMDSTAIAFCKDNELPIQVVNLNTENSIADAVCGIKTGTVIKS